MFLYLEGMGLPQCERHYSEFIAYFTKEGWRYRGVRKGQTEGKEREGEMWKEEGRRRGGRREEEGKRRRKIEKDKNGKRLEEGKYNHFV